MIFIKFTFLLFVLALVAIALIAYKFYKQLHRVVRRFQPEDNDFQGQQGGFQDQQSSARTSRQADGNTIVDSRSEEQRAKKVIKDNEGEYIDYQ